MIWLLVIVGFAAGFAVGWFVRRRGYIDGFNDGYATWIHDGKLLEAHMEAHKKYIRETK